MIQVAEKIWNGINDGLAAGKTIISEQGSSRSAKTFNTVIWLITYLLQNPGLRLSIVRKTLPALKGSVLIDFKDILNRMNIWEPKAFNKTELIYRLHNGSWIEFFSTDDEQKIRGRKRDILFCNEANEISYLEWQQLIMRTTRFAILDYNPSFSEDHWIEQVNRDPDTHHFISTYKDNPFLEQKIIDDIEKLKDKNRSLWTVYGLGLRAVIEGRIFDSYEIVDGIPEHVKKRFIGMDFGYTNAPTAIIEVGIFAEELYLDEICYRTRMLTNDIIGVLKTNCQKRKIISESADPRLIDEIYNAGLNIHAVEKYQGSVMAGITKMQEYKIKITKRSSNIKKELDNYVYDQDKEGKYINQPVDEFNHCFSGDTKIITKAGIKNIRDIKTSDIVLTSSGYHSVIKLYNNGIKQVNHYSLDFKSFKLHVCCTPNHLIKTRQGWIQISQLKPGMSIYLCRHLMAKYTDFIPVKDTFQEEQKECIQQYGNISTARFPKRMRSIIKTRTHTITELKILRLKKCKNINPLMAKKELLKTKNGLRNFMQPVLKRQRNGINLKTVSYGIVNTEKKLQEKENISFINASNAGKNINQKILQIQNSVRTIANRNTEELQDLTMKQEYVKNAAQNLLSINIQEPDFAASHVLENITEESGNKENVYDMQIECIHEYFANGILVHNSIDASRYVILTEVIGKNRRKININQLSELLP